jgi:magnesium-transporting ATPase (P-type)
MLLAYASKKLSDYNVLVKNLHGMDTLGTITLLASDKTGTLTMNVMVSSARYIWLINFNQYVSRIHMQRTPLRYCIAVSRGIAAQAKIDSSTCFNCVFLIPADCSPSVAEGQG